MRLFSAMSEKWQMTLIGPKGSECHVPENTEVLEIEVKPLWRFGLSALLQAVANAKRTKPTLIIAGSGLTAPIAYLVAKIARSKSVVYLHGLDLVVPNKIYQLLWLPLIRRCDHVFVNSQNTAKLAIQRGVQASRIDLLSPGTDIPELDMSAANAFRSQAGLGNRKILLSVGRLTARKGIAEFVAGCLPEIVRNFPDLIFLIIGSEASDALVANKFNQKNRIEFEASNAGVANNIKFLGYCDDQMLTAAYLAADIHVFPVLEMPGDIEGFGIVAIEAAAHGLHTIAFATGGVSESVADGRSGDLISPGDNKQFTKTILIRLAEGRQQSNINECRSFAEINSWDNFGSRTNELCAKLVEE